MNFSWYGFLVGCGAAAFWWQWQTLLEKNTSPEVSQRQFSMGALLIFGNAILGARLYHLWTDWSLYQSDPWPAVIEVWQGGLGIYGALCGGILGVFLWKFLSNIPVRGMILLDALAISLPLGQAIGRWGNYVNQELFGPPTTLPWGIFIEPTLRPSQFALATHFHPLFLYESLAMLSLWLFLRLLLWQERRHSTALTEVGSGLFTGLYLFTYGSIRFSLDILRWDLATYWGQLTVSQWWSLVMIGLGLVFLRQIPYNWKEV